MNAFLVKFFFLSFALVNYFCEDVVFFCLKRFILGFSFLGTMFFYVVSVFSVGSDPVDVGTTVEEVLEDREEQVCYTCIY